MQCVCAGESDRGREYGGRYCKRLQTQAYRHTHTRDIQTDTYQSLKRVDDRHTDRQIPETYRQTHTRVSREWTTGIPHGPMSVPVFIALFRVLFLHQISA
jgi:hypothetical protein